MYRWTHTESPSPAALTPGKLETLLVWPHSDKKNLSSPPRNRLDGESKIPKLLSSTPKPRLQLNSDSMSSSASSNNSSATTMHANNKMNELKCKLQKCEKAEDMFIMIRNFLQDFTLSSSGSTIIASENGSKDTFSASMLNSSEMTVFDHPPAVRHGYARHYARFNPIFVPGCALQAGGMDCHFQMA